MGGARSVDLPLDVGSIPPLHDGSNTIQPRSYADERARDAEIDREQEVVSSLQKPRQIARRDRHRTDGEDQPEPSHPRDLK